MKYCHCMNSLSTVSLALSHVRMSSDPAAAGDSATIVAVFDN